jgi:beta-1,4-mannosyl-glycoprotein beta-1,4-N-acetylglucosaminyltransferase
MGKRFPKDSPKKIRSFVHGEFNRDDIVNEENIRLKIEKNEDVFGRGYKIKRIEMNESFPKYILDNKEKLKEWIV